MPQWRGLPEESPFKDCWERFLHRRFLHSNLHHGLHRRLPRCRGMPEESPFKESRERTLRRVPIHRISFPYPPLAIFTRNSRPHCGRIWRIL
jgi:hypothetical protein